MGVKEVWITALSQTCDFMHILNTIVNNIGNIKDATYVFLNIALGVGAFKGLSYLKTYREKRHAATFTFWAQLRIRLMQIENWLKDNSSLVNYFYNEETRCEWEGESSDLSSRIVTFKNLIEDTIEFIQKSPDQMPAYIGWTDDYNSIISFLSDAIQFDICNGSDYFKFEGRYSIKERNAYVESVCEVLDRMCNNIMVKQRQIEREICSEK